MTLHCQNARGDGELGAAGVFRDAARDHRAWRTWRSRILHGRRNPRSSGEFRADFHKHIAIFGIIRMV